MIRKRPAVLAAAALVLFAACTAKAQSAASVSPAVVKAFSDAGLPLLRQPVTPYLDFSARLAGSPQTKKLSDLKGTVVFLNFWAAWCGPCRSEMPSMEALYRRLKSRGFEMLGVNCGEKEADVTAFMRDNKLSFKTALDLSGEISRSYGISAIPSTFIIGRDGQIISRITGSLDWNSPKIAAAFEALLKDN